MTYVAAEDRYEKKMPYRRCGRGGIELPQVSLGLWQNFGDDRSIDTQRAILRRAFDLGVSHSTWQTTKTHLNCRVAKPQISS